jgi:pimeloyl-ACP methyl ester carboxylesterase
MRNQENLNTQTPPTRRGRRFLIGLGRAFAVLLVLLLAGALYETSAEAADVHANPPPGKLVDVGGYRLHIHCSGSGSPTVVIETGYGDSSASWGRVQSEVALTTRVCTYDRAGTGWSEPSPQPRNAREFAKELHTLLANANEQGPYVLAGHSLGGYTVRVFAHDYPTEVSGLVLMDAQKLPAPDIVHPSPAPKPGRISLPWLVARVGVVRLLSGLLGSPEGLPPQDQRAYNAFSVTPRSVQAVVDEGMGMAEGGVQARAVTSLGTLPIIVLSRGKDQSPDWTASQASFLKLSTNSQQLFAEQSGHSINFDQPEAASAAIVKMVELVRK